LNTKNCKIRGHNSTARIKKKKKKKIKKREVAKLSEGRTQLQETKLWPNKEQKHNSPAF
jgi:hypothetical protein